MSDASGGSVASAPDAGDSPGTSTPAPGSSPQQDAPQDNEVVVVPGSTSGGGAPQQSVNIKRPARVFLVKGGEEYVVPEATKNAVSSYVVPEGFQQEGAREDSFMFSLGIYCVPIGVVRRSSAENKAFFRCMVGACIKSGKTVPCGKGNKSNVNKHLRDKHDLRGGQGKAREERAQTRQGNIVSAMAAATTFGVGARRCVLFKRARTGGAGSSRRKNNDDDFSMFGRNEVAPSQNEGDVDLLEEEVSSEIMRYKGVFMKSTDRSTPSRSSCFLSWRAASRRTLIREIFEGDGARMYTGIQTVLKDISWRPRRHAPSSQSMETPTSCASSPHLANLIVERPCSKTCTSTLPTSGLFVDDMK